MTAPEGKQPQLISCQELSKQCNDVDSSSAGDNPGPGPSPPSRTRKMVCRNAPAESCSSSRHARRKFPVGSPAQFWRHVPDADYYRPRAEPHGPEESTGSQMFEEKYDYGDYSDDDDDSDEELHNPDTTHRKHPNCLASEWASLPEGAGHGHLPQQGQDFLDDIESTLHWQVDDEIEVFRSSLHSIISRQHSQCRHLLLRPDQEDEGGDPSRTPPSHPSPVYPYQEESKSPDQVLPLAPESEDVWTSDIMQSLSEQQTIEAMSTSTSSLAGDEGVSLFVSTSGKEGPSQDVQLNRLTIKLLSSALCISNAMHSKEYAT